MKKIILFFVSFLMTSLVFGQCDLDFGSGATPLQFTFAETGGTDIVNAGSGTDKDTDSQSFDIWDENTNDCSVGGGLNDITFDFELIHTFDQYGTDGVASTYGGPSHEIDQSSSGLNGKMVFGSSSTTVGSAGDVRGYKIKVTFADHVVIEAGDLTVNLSSVNTAATAHESCALVFFNEGGVDYGTVTYDGYYDGGSGALTDGSCTAPAIRANSWSTTGPGTYTASNTISTSIVLDVCNPAKGSNGANNSYDVNAETDTGLTASDRIGGFIFYGYLEDVAGTAASGATTSTGSSPSSTLNGLSIASLVLPVDFVSFNARVVSDIVALDWSTRSEERNDHFDIEWGVDGNRFEKIGEIEGQGNSSELNEYQFVHDAPLGGANYYRLKQVDWNGSFEYSEVRSVKIDEEKRIKIYPSIVNNEELNLEKPAVKSTISIFTINGSLVQQINDQEGQLLQINTNDLPKGSYMISVQTNNRFYTERFIKL